MQAGSLRIITNSILSRWLLNILFTTGHIPLVGWLVILLTAMELVPVITLVPRLILSARKIHCDLGGRRGTTGSDIDTPFGFASASSDHAVAGTLMFTDAKQNERIEQGEEMQMEEGEIRIPQDSI